MPLASVQNTPQDDLAPAFPERQLVDKAKTGDPEALGQLYDLYYLKVYRYVLARIRDVPEAEDITAEVFIKMLDGIQSFRWRQVPFAAWLFRIARNHLVSHVRKNGHRRTEAILSDATADPNQDVTAAVETRISFEEVMEATQRLPAAQREVIVLRFAVGLSVSDTAATLGKRAGTVKVLQHKAIAKLQKLVIPEEERSPNGSGPRSIAGETGEG